MAEKKIISNTFLFLFISIILVSAYFIYRKISEKHVQAVEAVPPSSAFFIKASSLLPVKEALSNNGLWKAMGASSAINMLKQELHILDSAGSSSERAKALLYQQPLILSVHAGQQDAHLLYIIDIKTAGHPFFNSFFQEAYGANFTTIQSSYRGEKIKKLVFNNRTHTFSYAIIGGLFLGSLSNDLLRESIDCIKNSDAVESQAAFRKVALSAGKKVDANIFVNYAHFGDFLDFMAAGKNSGLTASFAQLADWTALDVLLKEDEILMSGYTDFADSAQSFFQIFAGRQAPALSAISILPYNTTLLHHFGYADFPAYLQAYKEYCRKNNKADSLSAALKQVDSRLKTSAETSLFPYMGSEWGFVSCARTASELKSKSWAFVKINNLSQMQKQLGQISKKIAGSRQLKTYKGFSISKLNVQELLENMLGWHFRHIDNFCYTFISDFLLVANSAEAIESFIDTYQNGKTLDLSENYKTFSDNIATHSNYYLYFNIHEALPLLKEYVSPVLFEKLMDDRLVYQKFQAFGLQFAHSGSGIYSSLYLKYNPEMLAETNVAWKIHLDADIHGAPQLLRNHKSKSNYIMVADVENTLCLFDAEARLLWKNRLQEPLQSSVYEVDYYKNGKIQYLFNTENYLYMFDLLGRGVESYPLSLKVPATNGVAVFDYEKNKDYRLLIGGADKQLYNFTVEGKMVKDWNKSKTEEPLTLQVQHLRRQGKDYILLSDQAGRVSIIDRRGRDRIRLKKPFAKAENSDFYINETNDKGIFISTNTQGKLCYITASGDISQADFGDFSERHHFLYEDFNGDGHKDFIFLDQNHLRVFDRFKKNVFSYSFAEGEVLGNLCFFKPDRASALLALRSETNNKIYLFTKNGEAAANSGLPGSTPFALKSLKNNDQANIIVGHGNTLYNYIIQ